MHNEVHEIIGQSRQGKVEDVQNDASCNFQEKKWTNEFVNLTISKILEDPCEIFCLSIIVGNNIDN